MEREIPRSHIAKHQNAGKKIHHRVLHNGQDAAGKFDNYDAAKKRASQYRGQMKKQGYDHKGVKVHHYVSEENQMKTYFEFRDQIDSYTIELDDLEEDTQLDEAPKGTVHHVSFTFKDKSGKGTANATHKLYAPSKDHAERWTTKKHGNKPGFKITRIKDTKISEDSQLDELSKKTLGSYVKKASDDAVVKSALSVGDKGGKRWKATLKRLKGIHKASDRLAKEDTEISEISQKLIDHYREKAHRDKKQREKGREMAFAKSTGRAKINPPESRAYHSKANVYKGK